MRSSTVLSLPPQLVFPGLSTALQQLNHLISPYLVEIFLDLSPLLILASKSSKNERDSDDRIPFQTFNDVGCLVTINSANRSLKTVSFIGINNLLYH